MMLNNNEIKQIAQNSISTTLNSLIYISPAYKNRVEKLFENEESFWYFVNEITEHILQRPRIQDLINYAAKINEEFKFATIEEQIELKKFFILHDVIPVITEEINQFIFNDDLNYEIDRQTQKLISYIIDDVIDSLLKRKTQGFELLEINVGGFFDEILINHAPLLIKSLVAVVAFTILTIIALVFRIPHRLILSVSSVLRNIGNYLKDIQKDNLTITEFFKNIPPECLKEYTDIWPILKQPGIDPYRFKSEDELRNYSKDVLDKLRKKLMSINIASGIYNKTIIAKSKGTICSIRYFISLTGILLVTYYHCLAKNNHLKILNDMLKIKSSDIMATDGDILDSFAELIPNICLLKYKDFKKTLKFITEVIKTIYKDTDPELYSKLLNELLDTINKAHLEGEKLLKRVNKNNRSKRQ